MALARLRVSVVIITLLSPALVAANGFDLNGLGSRALSMGGAFVAVADDFTTIYWNPAGAAGFTKPTVGFHAFDLLPAETYRYGTPPNYYIDAESKPAHVLGGLAAFYKPVSSRVVVGFGVSTPSGTGGAWKEEDIAPFSRGILYKWSSGIGVLSFSPLLAAKINGVVSVGATFNLNYGTSSLSTIAGVYELPETPGVAVDLGQYDESMSGWSYGATLGVLVSPGERFRFGLTVKTPHTIKFKGTGITSLFPLYGHAGTSQMEREFTWPLSVTGGVAVRPLSRLLVTADVQWTQWSVLERNITAYDDPYWDQFWGAEGYNDILMAWEDKTQIRVGAEYAVSPVLALRAGYRYDPAPSPDKTMNLLLPTYTYNTITVGLGYEVSGVKIDAGLEYMGGKDRIIVRSGHNDPGTYGMRMIIPSLSFSYGF